MTAAQPAAAAVLRPMRPGDLDAVLVLERELFPEDAWSRQMLAGELAQQPGRRGYLVAEAGGRLVGYAGAGITEGLEADVMTIAVAREHWGQGIGGALLSALTEQVARRGCRELFLEVRADNPRARDLYLRYGFTQIGVRRGYYQPSGTDAIVMRKELTR